MLDPLNSMSFGAVSFQCSFIRLSVERVEDEFSVCSMIRFGANSAERDCANRCTEGEAVLNSNSEYSLVISHAFSIPAPIVGSITFV